jgi:hypothetical protein
VGSNHIWRSQTQNCIMVCWRPLKIFRAPQRLACETDAAIAFARSAERLFANDVLGPWPLTTISYILSCSITRCCRTFQRCGAQLLAEKMQMEDQDWDWYFLMRHHDAPTRLLDWSDGALIALHFALNRKTRDALRDPKTKEYCKPRVYVLGPDRLKDYLNFICTRQGSNLQSCDPKSHTLG